MRSPASDGLGVLKAWDCYWEQSVNCISQAKLVLAVVAPGPDRTVIHHGNGVRDAARDVPDARDARYGGGHVAVRRVPQS